MTTLICLIKTSPDPSTGLPKTQTEINKQFVFITIARYLKKHRNLAIRTAPLQSLPKPYINQFQSLAKLAFIFLGKDKIVFNDNDIAIDCPDCVGKWNSLGLLKIVKYNKFFEDSVSISYNFLHFSVQEFLAAFHISSVNNNPQIKFMNKIFWSSRYLNAGIMFFGLTGGNSFAVNHYLSGHKFAIFSKLFGADKICQAVTRDKIKCLHLFQCFLEADNSNQVGKVGKILLNDTIDLSNNVLLLKDIHIFSFFLIRSVNKTWKMLNLSSCYIGDHGFSVFVRSFAESSKHKITVKSVNISSNHLTSVSINGIISLINCFKTEKIVLYNNSIDYKLFEDAVLTYFINSNRTMMIAVEKKEDHETDFYYINCQFNVKKDSSLFSPNFKCNIYLWSTNYQFDNLKTFVSDYCQQGSSISIYEENLKSFQLAVNIVLELEQLCFHTNSQVEYILQTRSSLFAANSTATKILQALNCDYLWHHNNNSKLSGVSQGKTVHIQNCPVGDTSFQIIVSCFLNNKLRCILMFLMFHSAN